MRIVDLRGHRFVLLLPLALLPAAGCGGGASAGSPMSNNVAPIDAGSVEAAAPGIPSPSGLLIPVAVGDKWVYRTTNATSSVVIMTQSVVEAYEDVGGAKAGTMAYRVRSTTLTGSTVNWQQTVGMVLVRQREQFLDLQGTLLTDYVFTPYRVRLDETAAHTVTGATWVETNTAAIDNLSLGTKVTGSFSVQWTVDSAAETVTVPAGTFTCLRVHRVETGYASTDEVQWFANGIGKVKETGTMTNGELVSYAVH
jgi:hypothetical protein